jgi:acyl dehydratase
MLHLQARSKRHEKERVHEIERRRYNEDDMMCFLPMPLQRALNCQLSQPRFLRMFVRSSSSSTSESPLPKATLPIVSGTIPRHGKGVAVNQYAEVRRTFTAADVIQFSHLVGDYNPLHSSAVPLDSPHFPLQILVDSGVIQRDATSVDESDAKATTMKPLVHGMLSSSLFSCIFGTLIPGSIYRSQVLHFRQPIFAQDSVVGRVQVTSVRPISNRSKGGLLVVCDTTVFVLDAADEHQDNPQKRGKLCIEGHAHVWLPTGTLATKGQDSQ